MYFQNIQFHFFSFLALSSPNGDKFIPQKGILSSIKKNFKSRGLIRKKYKFKIKL